MYPVRTPSIIRTLAPYAVWSMKVHEKIAYLTFDDGPTPGITERALDILGEHGARATFFCLGKNVQAHPHLFRRIVDEGHHVGHHSWSHADGWKQDHFAYIREVLRGAYPVGTNLYRPPYGRITPRQAQSICHRYKLIMWDIISGDFDIHLTPETCTSNVMRHIRPGSIIVFHDSIKAAPRMLGSLPEVLQQAQKKGFRFEPIPYT
ncbi:MAG: polysaccharide deacetylase family protein [Flavobacteriales bacterium]